MNCFAHLFCCSCYSFHRGAFTPRQLVHAAKSAGANAAALTDYRGLYGAVPFYRAAREAGIRPIFGASFPAPTPGGALIVLARDAGGYGNLCRLITADQLARPKPGRDPEARSAGRETPDVSAPGQRDLLDLALEFAEGLVFLTSDPDFLERLRPHLARDALYAEFFRGESARSRHLMRRVCELARKLDLRGAATNRVHFLAPEDHAFHRLLRAIGTLKTVETLTDEDMAPPSCFFASPAQMAESFRDLPDALRATVDIAEACEVNLPLGRMRMPDFDAGAGASPEEVLREACRSAIPRFYAPPNRPAAQVRLEHELEVICSMGYAPYFLAVADVVRFANDQGIPATGRGSAADSLVSYLLGFTHVDPIAHNLYFERFLNRERSSPPDVDIDLCWRRRDDVIDYVYRRWGEDRVAMISTHVTYAGRSCVREVGKAMGLSEGEIGQYTRYLPHLGAADFSNVRKERPESRHLDFEAEPMRSIAPLAKRIEGYPSHLGVHPSGIVVSPEPLTNWVPLERAA
ncbi:MAG TPA: PHP domain-containing protein, partial [Sumerlaeia bacterium]|nr:PHP domain-containing protein [Sumerlaeia bacterium]